jgi:hypothetical protein
VVLLGLVMWSPQSANATAGGASADSERREPSPYANVRIQGKLEQDRFKHEAPFYGSFSTGWYVLVNGQRFWVDFGDNKELLESAKKLAGKRVMLDGSFERRAYAIPMFWIGPEKRPSTDLGPWPAIKEPRLQRAQVIRATSLEKLADTVTEDVVNIELLGKLSDLVKTKLPPITVWEVKVGDQSFHLRLDSTKLKGEAEKLAGLTVWISGTLENGVVVVASAGPPMAV